MNAARSFIQVWKAWYASSALVGDIECFDINVEGQDWSAQFSVHWPQNSPSGSAELVVLDDAWRALASCNDLITRVGSTDTALSPDELREHLLACGFADKSEINPGKSAP